MSLKIAKLNAPRPGARCYPTDRIKKRERELEIPNCGSKTFISSFLWRINHLALIVHFQARTIETRPQQLEIGIHPTNGPGSAFCPQRELSSVLLQFDFLLFSVTYHFTIKTKSFGCILIRLEPVFVLYSLIFRKKAPIPSVRE